MVMWCGKPLLRIYFLQDGEEAKKAAMKDLVDGGLTIGGPNNR